MKKDIKMFYKIQTIKPRLILKGSRKTRPILLDLFSKALSTVLNQDYIEYSCSQPPLCAS